MDWLEIAETLKTGGSTRVNCPDCTGGGKSMVISNTPRGYSSKCFRCGDDSRKFKPHTGLSFSEVMAMQRALEAVVSAPEPTMPEDAVPLPLDKGLWLYKYGIRHSTALEYGFMWSAKLGRIIIPARLQHGTVLQMRSVYGHTPKYLNIGNPNGDTFKCSTSGPANYMVITEDVLSAIKVSNSCYTESTLGVVLSDKAANRIVSMYPRGFVWYDGDKAGILGSKKAVNVLTALGGQYVSIHTDLDPKEYTYKQIQEILDARYQLIAPNN